MATYYVRMRGRSQGPYSDEQMRAMAQRGQLSRVHSISVDEVSWSPAQEYPQFFVTDSSAVQQAVSNSSASLASIADKNDSASSANFSNSPNQLWYFEKDGQKHGPDSVSKIQHHLKTKSIGGNNLVWCEGMGDWMPLKAVPEFAWMIANTDAKPKYKSKPLLTMIAGAITALVICLPVYYFVVLKNESTDNSQTDSNSSQAKRNTDEHVEVSQSSTQKQRNGGGVNSNQSSSEKSGQIVSREGLVTDVRNHQSIRKSVGFVVCGFKIIVNGKAGELPTLGNGSCFAVNSKGHFLTNRHVIEEVDGFIIDDTVKEKHQEDMYKIFHAKSKLTPQVWIFIDGVKHEATIENISDKYDLAILKVDLKSPASFHALSANRDISALTEVYAIGFPDVNQEAFAFSDFEKAKKQAVMSKIIRDREPTKVVEKWFEVRYYDPTITQGVTQRMPHNIEDVGSIIQHQAKIHHGNSGGPLMLASGEVIGINTWGNEAKDVNEAQTILQMRKEIDGHVPDVIWK